MELITFLHKKRRVLAEKLLLNNTKLDVPKRDVPNEQTTSFLGSRGTAFTVFTYHSEQASNPICSYSNSQEGTFDHVSKNEPGGMKTI